MTGKAYESQVKMLDKRSELDSLNDFISRFEAYLNRTTEIKSPIGQAPVAPEGAAANTNADPKMNTNTSTASNTGGGSMTELQLTDPATIEPQLKEMSARLSKLTILKSCRNGGMREIVDLYEKLLTREEKCRLRSEQYKRPYLLDYLKSWAITIENQPLNSIKAWFEWEIGYTKSLKIAFDAVQQYEGKIKSQLALVEKLAAKGAQDKVEQATALLGVYKKIEKLCRDAISKEHIRRYWKAKERLFCDEILQNARVQLSQSKSMADVWGKLCVRISEGGNEVKYNLSAKTLRFLTSGDEENEQKNAGLPAYGEPSAPPPDPAFGASAGEPHDPHEDPSDYPS